MAPAWVDPTHAVLRDAGVTLVGHVPDGGLKHLISRCDSDPDIECVSLTTEEEGIALVTGGWLGGARGVVLMQSSGVGNCINMLSLLASCGVPALFIVTMRGMAGEANPWQVPMGSIAGETLALQRVEVRRVDSAAGVAPTVAALAATIYHEGQAAAVLIDQAVVGVKRFAGDDGGTGS
ncbi:MAG: phosphonopyruvate decarboxylase [Actinomycetia bacterium]|nr:phosphonopyruvate decarboxylase [Actinomycetes bacterium]